MSVYKRGGVYWFEFTHQGQRIRRSTRQRNRQAAKEMEAAYRTTLAKGEMGLLERKPAPRLKDFAQKFLDAVQVEGVVRPRTAEFYAARLSKLLDFLSLANTPLDGIDEALIGSFVQFRSKQVSPASVNRELATLRRLLRLAQEWR